MTNNNRKDKIQISFRVSDKVNDDLINLADRVANYQQTGKPNKTGIARTSIKFFIQYINNDMDKYQEVLKMLNESDKEV